MSGPRKPTDRQLLIAIQMLMDGQEWGPGTLDQIAWLLNDSGYEVRDITPSDDDDTDEAPPDHRCAHVGPPGGICMRCGEEM